MNKDFILDMLAWGILVISATVIISLLGWFLFMMWHIVPVLAYTVLGVASLAVGVYWALNRLNKL